jgi:hypothetical protein
MNQASAEVIRNYRQNGLEWVTELGVDKVIRKTNRILRKWGIGHSVVLLHISKPPTSFYPHQSPHYAFGVEGKNIPLAYISPEDSEVLCDWGFLYTYKLPTVSEGLVHLEREKLADSPSPFLIPLPTALAVATLQFSLTNFQWWGRILPNFKNPRYMLVTFLSLSEGNQWVCKISAVFKKRVAHCTITKCQVGREDTEVRQEFKGKHEKVVREILKIAALMTNW